MNDGGYDAFDDPYAYKGLGVLKNKAGLRDAELLESFELEMTTLRADEPLPAGRFGPAHYRAVHRHLFQDVYRWAGRYRTVRTSKGGNPFCYPEYIGAAIDKLFQQLGSQPFVPGAPVEAFAHAAAAFLGELNAIHAFREGNGRAQLAFLFLLGERAGHPLDLSQVERDPMLAAMIASYHGEIGPLTDQILGLAGVD